MLKNLLIGVCVLIVIGILFAFPGETMSSTDMSDYTLGKAYLAKNTERYTRCYNSVNYGISGLTDVEIALMGEYFNDPRVSSVSMKSVEKSFLSGIKQKCDKTISDYESAYQKTETIQMKSESLRVGWRTLISGGADQKIPTRGILLYRPENVRMNLPFNSYIFTNEEAHEYFIKQLNI